MMDRVIYAGWLHDNGKETACGAASDDVVATASWYRRVGYPFHARLNRVLECALGEAPPHHYDAIAHAAVDGRGDAQCGLHLGAPVIDGRPASGAPRHPLLSATASRAATIGAAGMFH